MCPVACPLASSSTGRKAPAGGGLPEIRMPNDWSLPVPLSRVSAGRLDSIASVLTDLEVAVARLVARARVCSGAQLEQLFWHHDTPASRARQARRVLARLTGWRLLDRLPRQIGGVRAGSRGFLYVLGPAGVRLLARLDGRRVRRLNAPGDRYVNHTLAISGLYTELVIACRTGRAELLSFDFEPQCWMQFPGPWGTSLTLKPDAAVRLGIEEYEYASLLELDMATESLPTIERKARRHLDYYRSGEARRLHGVSPRVVWITPDVKRALRVRRVLNRLGDEAHRLFVVVAAEEAASFLTTGMPS